jgi:hypothetical protein
MDPCGGEAHARALIDGSITKAAVKENANYSLD